MRGMLWGERVTRRRALVGLLVAFAIADAALAYVVIQPDARAAVPVAQPLHPVVGDFRPDGTRLTDCTDQRCFQQAFGNIAYREAQKRLSSSSTTSTGMVLIRRATGLFT
jgi:hypothetical protein